MSTVDQVGQLWRKSSYSGNGNNDNCVEVAFASAVAVRDSKSPATGRLIFPTSAWQRFLRP